MNMINPLDLIKQALEQDTPMQFSCLMDYMLAFTDNTEGIELKLGPEYDLEKVRYQGEVNDEIIFVDVIKQPLPMKIGDYKKRWIAIECTSLLGQMLLAAYEDILKMVQDQMQMPPEMKDKVIIK